MKITLLGQEFKSKKSAEDFIRSKLKDFNNSDPIWMELLSRHPDKEEKIGSGIVKFFTSLNPINPNGIQLNILRTDQSIIDISWRACVAGKGKTDLHKLKEAMRLSISDQTQDFKSRKYLTGISGWECSLCKKHILIRQNAHVDHYCDSFLSISESFIKLIKDVPTKFDACGKSNSAKLRKEDWRFQGLWREYHLSMSSLRILCKGCNLKRPKYD